MAPHRPEEDTNYNGADITINKRMSHHWSLTGGASFGKTTGDALGGDLNNPNSDQYRYGIFGNDVTQGTTTVWMSPRGDTRLPNVAQLDMSFRKVFRVGSNTFEPRLDAYNLTNQASIIGRVAQYGPAYGRASSIQRGRLIKLGFSAEF